MTERYSISFIAYSILIELSRTRAGLLLLLDGRLEGFVILLELLEVLLGRLDRLAQGLELLALLRR